MRNTNIHQVVPVCTKWDYVVGLEVERILPMLWRRSAYAVWFRPRLRYHTELLPTRTFHNKFS